MQEISDALRTGVLYLISARLDNEIKAGARPRLDGHLHDHADCHATADAFAPQHAELTDTFEVRARRPALVAKRVKLRLPAIPNKRHLRLSMSLLRAAAVAAAVAAVFYLSL